MNTMNISQTLVPQKCYKSPTKISGYGKIYHMKLQVQTQEPQVESNKVSGLQYLSEGGKEKALNEKANKAEKIKVKKCGSNMYVDIEELAQMVRDGQTKWEDVDLDDIDVRLKWVGLFHRRKRTPGKFMMRLKVPNGILNSKQLRYFGESLKPLGEDGCGDITTRANIQLRGMGLDSAGDLYKGIKEIGLSSVMSGMDNVRNITGNPLAGIDPHELVDTRPICDEINNLHTNYGKGNPELSNLPRKLNISVSSTRDDFVHSHINDLAFEAIKDPESGEVGFNIIVGGYISVKRIATSIPLDCYVTQDQVAPFAIALLKFFRDYGQRTDRQKTRFLWLVEDMGIDEVKEKISQYMGGTQLRKAVKVEYDTPWERRSLLGIHNQKQDGLVYVGVQCPVGRLQSQDFLEMADVCEKYGDSTIRLTPDQKIIYPNIPQDKVNDMLEEQIFQKFKVEPGLLVGNLVSCTGSQFCGLALIETKNRAFRYAKILEDQLEFSKPVRIHWTGCPNSCGQAQVADIGLMGGPAKHDGKMVEGVRIFTGGKVGEDAELASEFEKGIPVQEDILIPHLKQLLVEQFGAKAKN